MNEQELMKFVIERSNDPIIKNPVLRDAMNKDLGPRNNYFAGTLVKAGKKLLSKTPTPKPKPIKPSILKRETIPLNLTQVNEISKNKEFEQAWKNYKISIRKVGRRKFNKDQFFEIWARENMAQGGQAGQLVSNTVDGSRPGYAGDETFLVKVGKPLKVNNVIEQEFIEVTGSKNRPETYKKTGVKKTLYKPQIVVGNKTVLTTDFGTKDAATTAVEKYRIKNPIKNAPPDLDTLDEKKKKKYLDKRERSAKISKQGGVESFETGNKTIHKGHSQNIDNPDVPIKPSNIIYTPQKINQSMAGAEGKSNFTDLDYKIDVAEDKIRDIKKSNMSGAKKKVELEKLDTKLMKYVDDSNGYKTVTLSGGNTYGEIFQKSKSMDMFDEFPDKTEKETKKFVNQYFTDEGKLKDKWTKGNISSVDKANIQKSYVFLENIKNAKTNAIKTGTPLHNKLMKFCPKDVGGTAGVCSLDEAMRGMKEESKMLKSGKLNKPQAEQIAKKFNAVRRVGTGLAKGSKLMSWLGPYGLGGEIALEGMFVANDMLENGMTYKEALSNSVLRYALPKNQREKLEYNEDRNRKILGNDRRGLAADYVSGLKKQEDLIKSYNKFNKMNESDGVGNIEGSDIYDYKDIYKAEKDFGKDYDRMSPTYGKNIFDIVKYGSPEQQAFAAKEEAFDVRAMENRMEYDKNFFGPLGKEDFYSQAQLDMLDAKALSESKKIGQRSNEIKTQEIANFGGVANRAEGGIMGIKRK